VREIARSATRLAILAPRGRYASFNALFGRETPDRGLGSCPGYEMRAFSEYRTRLRVLEAWGKLF
jgi:hypothetical protein